MPKFQVTLVETVKYLVEVEAESADEAEEIAGEVWAGSENPTADFDGQGYGVECTHVCLDGVPQPAIGEE